MLKSKSDPVGLLCDTISLNVNSTHQAPGQISLISQKSSTQRLLSSFVPTLPALLEDLLGPSFIGLPIQKTCLDRFKVYNRVIDGWWSWGKMGHFSLWKTQLLIPKCPPSSHTPIHDILLIKDMPIHCLPLKGHQLHLTRQYGRDNSSFSQVSFIATFGFIVLQGGTK